MNLKTIAYSQLESLKQPGKQLLAWYDDNHILVYIPHIGEFYDDKTVSRPIWITPSFTWMMEDAHWLESPYYETIECMVIHRFAFDDFLSQAFPADFPNHRFESEDEWRTERASATVQFRWLPDFTPDGKERDNKVLLMGIHSRTWMQFVIKEHITPYNNIDPALFSQKEHTQPPYDLLIVPEEKPYPLTGDLKTILGIASEDLSQE